MGGKISSTVIGLLYFLLSRYTSHKQMLRQTRRLYSCVPAKQSPPVLDSLHKSTCSCCDQALYSAVSAIVFASMGVTAAVVSGYLSLKMDSKLREVDAKLASAKEYCDAKLASSKEYSDAKLREVDAKISLSERDMKSAVRSVENGLSMEREIFENRLSHVERFATVSQNNLVVNTNLKLDRFHQEMREYIRGKLGEFLFSNADQRQILAQSLSEPPRVEKE